MRYANPPVNPPQNIHHETFSSRLAGQPVGFCIYLPPAYGEGGLRYPVHYHLHGYTGNESSEIETMERVCKGREAITVFPNSTFPGKQDDALGALIDAVVITELIPYIDAQYGTDTRRGSRAVSGFSMGGATAFRYALTYPELFSAVTAYAGTYHHWYRGDYRGVGEPREKAAEMYEAMKDDARYVGEGTLLHVIWQNAQAIREGLAIQMIIGGNDPLICDNEILHMYLDDLRVPHGYRVIGGTGHVLRDII